MPPNIRLYYWLSSVMIFLRDVPLLVAGGEAEEGAVGDHDCHLHEQRPALHQPGPHQVICFLPQ